MRSLLLLFLFILTPQACAADRRQSHSTACKSNLVNIATSLEMYSTENQGHYPATLAELTPKYLHTVPRCPAAEGDTYSPSYVHASSPGTDRFLVYCSGLNHQAANFPANYPAINSFQGRIPSPDGVGVEECRARLESGTDGGHIVSQKCWGHHLHEGVATLERSGSGPVVLRRAVYIPDPLPPLPTWQWWCGPLVLVIVLGAWPTLKKILSP